MTSTTQNTCPVGAVCGQGGLQIHHPLIRFFGSVEYAFHCTKINAGSGMNYRAGAGILVYQTPQVFLSIVQH